jgi:hypothetical protein
MAIPPTTLAELATETVDLYADAIASAQADLTKAQAALAAARELQAADTTLLAETQKELAALRAELSITEVPADADALLVEIAELQVEERRQGALLLDDADAVAGAQAAADAATAWLRALNRRAGEAAAAVAAAEAEKEWRDRWKDAVVLPPLDTLAIDAGGLRDGAEFIAADAQVVNALPQAIRDAVDQGWAVESERLKQAAESEEHAWDLLEIEVTAGSPVILAHTLAVADEALRRWAEQGTQRYARAAAQLAVLQDPVLDPLLTEAQFDALAANVTDGPAAAALRTAQEVARQARLVAQASLDDATLTARAADPTDLDVTDAVAVATQQAALQVAVTSFNTAEAAYDGQEDDWGEWSGDVPESAWKKVVGLKEATATLDELRDVVGAALVTADENAEAALADALWTAEQQALKVSFLESQAALRAVLLEQTRAARPARLLAALRGDA